ncbi:MAG TPA: DUF885 domain-containing protein [Acidothermaceae bacterium]
MAEVEALEAFASAAVEDILVRQPVMASSLGDHRFDGRLDDLHPAVLNEERKAIAARLVELHQWDDVELPIGHRVDAEVLSVRLRDRLFDIEEDGEYTWNPLAANPGTALYLLLARDYAPLPERLRSAGSRLRQIPEQLEVARATLHDMPRVHVETAIGQFGGTLGLLDDIAREIADVPDLRREVEPALDGARAALNTHVDWLTGELESAAGDPRLGRETFARKLSLVLDVEMTPEQVLQAAMDELVLLEDRIAQVAAQLGGTPREVLDRLALDAPTNDTIVAVAKDALAETTAFVAEHDLITMYDDPVEVIVMPEIHRGVAVAYCDPPGPLDPPGTTTFFAISPTPTDWPAERVASFYREVNSHNLRNLVIHEAMPGHVLQLAHSRRGPVPTRVHQTYWSGPFVEGWAVYAEAEMVRRGFGGLPVAMQQLKMRLRATINAVLDVRVHCDGLTEAEAMELMTGRGHQEEGEAAGKWRRALLTSAQLSTYYIGGRQVTDVVGRLRAAHPRWSDRQIHDTILGNGNPPPRHLPALLGLE